MLNIDVRIYVCRYVTLVSTHQCITNNALHTLNDTGYVTTFKAQTYLLCNALRTVGRGTLGAAPLVEVCQVLVRDLPRIAEACPSRDCVPHGDDRVRAV
jgi:hypothetical protein